jgi:hypothetical protein
MANGTGPGDLYALAAELRDVCIEALDTIPTFTGLEDLDGAPEYSFVSEAAPIPDCCDDGMLAVHVNNVTDVFARNSQPQAPKANVPNLIVSVLRCLPLGEVEGDTYTPPAADEIEAAARQTLADGWALWNHIYNLIRHEPPLFLNRCQRADFLGMQSIRPGDGQCGGWQLAFAAELAGYDEELGT